MKSESSFFGHAKTPEVVRTAVKMSLIVGTVLCLINHGPAYFNGDFSSSNVMQMMLTYLVPYCVSTYSSVKMIERFSDRQESSQ